MTPNTPGCQGGMWCRCPKSTPCYPTKEATTVTAPEAPLPLLAWHGSEELKAATVERMRKHRDQDDFDQGDYLFVRGDTWKGCFHGCLTAEKLAEERGVTVPALGRHMRMGLTWWKETERLFGIPDELCARLDGAFEDCRGVEAAGRFAVEALEAIPVGADLSGIAAAMDDDEHAVIGDIYNHARVLDLLAAAPVPALAGAES